MELVNVICVVIAVYLLLKILQNWLASKVEDLSQELEDMKELIHVVKVEMYGDMFYWYDKDDDVFLAQGKSIEDIVSVVKTRYPKHLFVLDFGEKKYALQGPSWSFIQIEGIEKRKPA